MRPLLLLLALLAAGPAAAQVESRRPDQVAVVLYRERGIAAITEARTVDLPAGRTRIAFRDVADEIVPQTATLEGLPGPQAERDYDFDLLSPGALLDKAVGERARLVRANPRKGDVTQTPVTIRSGPDGVVLQTDDGRTEALHCSGLPEKLVFDRAPPGLSATPTLSVTVDAPRAGRYVLKLSYLAEGLSWSADYVAKLLPDGHSLDLTGWLTLSNHGATSFGDAPTQVVAGTLNWGGGYDRPQAEAVNVQDGCWPIGHGRFATFARFSDASPAMAIPAPPPPPPPMVLNEVMVTAARKMATVSDLGDYKLYSLPEPTTVAAHQTKQVAFLDRQSVPFDRVYVFAVSQDDDDDNPPMRARVVLRMQNLRDRGLGEPLPAGQAAVYEPGPDARLLFTGKRRIQDTPVGLPVEIGAGFSTDVTAVARTVSSSVRMQGGVKLTDRRLVLTASNAGGAAADVEFKLPLNGLRILDESTPHAVKDGAAVWALRTSPGKPMTLTVAMETRG